MQCKHLSLEERIIIKVGFLGDKPIRQIAKQLGREPSTVSREIRKNLPPERRIYGPLRAHQRALGKRRQRGRKDRLKSDLVREYVVRKLKKRWSPEQVSGRIKKDLGERISHEAIYQFVYNSIYQEGHGYVKPGQEDLRQYLRRRKKRRTHKGMRRCQKMSCLKGKSIDTRPLVVEERSRIGDWETDTIVSREQRPGVNTLVERKTGLVFITKLKDKTSRETADAITMRMSSVPRERKHTLTMDNGPENQGWVEIEKNTSLDCYHAHPYSSYERGTNENANGLVRDYFPKKTDFTKISAEGLTFVERELNTRPRKRLGYLTPLEVWSVALTC